MKKIGLLIVLLALTSCSKPTSTEKQPQLPKTSPTPAAATPEPVVEAAPPPEIAPSGTFFLLTPASVETSKGLRELPPGTGVQLVRPGIYLTPLGEGPIADAHLTNDIKEAREARDASYTSLMTLAPRAVIDSTIERERAISTLVADAVIPTPESNGNAEATPTPRPITPIPVPAMSIASQVETKKESGIIWQKSPDGKFWEPIRYYSGSRKNLPACRPVK